MAPPNMITLLNNVMGSFIHLLDCYIQLHNLSKLNRSSNNSKGSIHMGSQVASRKSQVPLMLASPNMEAKSQLLSLEKPLKFD